METNKIIEELKAVEKLPVNPDQKHWLEQRAKDAHPVECVRMRDVFTPDQLRFLSQNTGFKARQKECYRNATTLIDDVEWMAAHYDPAVPELKYVEGFVYSLGLLPIEHAFVKVGDKYIDPTFERAMHLDVRKEIYVSCIELDVKTMRKYLVETGYYGELYLYDYFLRFRPELAERIRERNPHRNKIPAR